MRTVFEGPNHRARSSPHRYEPRTGLTMGRRRRSKMARRLASSAPLIAVAMAAVFVSSPVPAGAGELRVLLEGETGVRNDGNLSQAGQQSGQLDPQAQNVGRAGLNLQL